ncbi:hypothetical protein ACLE20_04050 [Rhizobium sp. YIM 134829]|uniref:hypothetical protein n=1 Tax=Rhizobium sp. YIM 134829 TaxID=3390453 RepID=UPI00397B0A69
MTSSSANIVDFNAYREARRKTAAPQMSAPADTLGMANFLNGVPPMMVWVPVWAFFPVMAAPWPHAQ